MKRLIKTGLSKYYGVLGDSIRTARLATHSTSAMLQGGVFPAADAMVAMNRDVANAVFGDGSLEDVTHRFRAAARFETIVQELGKELFGTATFENETVLHTDSFFRLTRITPREPSGVALFHSGGSIPYGDRLFRLLPSHNFFDRLLERGITIYAMEQIGDRYQNDYSGLTMPALVSSIEAMSDVAFADHGKKLVIEGYCGHGTQALAYLAAKPESAERKFGALALFVSPIDGTRCTDLAKPIALMPKALRNLNLALFEKMGGYVPADPTRMSLDLGLESVFPKTPFGYFYEGWQTQGLADVRSVEDLTPNQQRHLAGAYWVSAACARRFPVPFDIARFTSELFEKGLDREGTLPFEYEGRRPKLTDIVTKTSIRAIGFYGGKDPVVPDSTAHVLFDMFGDRYRHVVHPHAGHVSYVLSHRPHRPDPIDAILEIAP